MAELLLARTAPTARPLVLKWIRPEQAIDGTFIATFASEGRRAAQLRHPNIVEVHEVGREDGTHYLAMEYVHGDDARKLLARLHERRAKLPVQHILAISTAVAQALHHAHEQADGDGKPVLHLGIKPANVIITADGAVKLADFGIGRAALTEGHTDLLPVVVGYLAPEQCVGHPVDRRTDVFGLGILMYELAVGRRLFKGDNDFVTMATIVAGDIPPPTKHRGDLPKDLEAVIMKALARAPEDRYQTAQELQTALDKFATKAGVRGSLTTLAGYTKRLFGVRPEPWLVEEDATESGPASIDFDGSPKGIAVPPPEAALGQLPGFVPAAEDSPVVRLRKKVSREMPTEQLNLGALKAPLLPDKSAPVKIPAASSSRTSKPTRAPVVPAPTPARVKPKTVQIPVVVEKVIKEDSTEVTLPGREEKTAVFGRAETTDENPTRPSLADALVTPTKPVERAQTPTIPDARAAKERAKPGEDDTPSTKAAKPVSKPAKPAEPAKAPEKKPNGINGAPRPLASLLSLSQPDANREAPKPKLPPPSRKEPEAKVEVDDDLQIESTAVANPPPMPVVATTAARDITEHVRPLPAPGDSAAGSSDTLTTRHGRKKWLVVGALAAAAAATIAIVIGFGGKPPTDPPPPPAASTTDEPAQGVTPDEPEPPSEPDKPTELRTSSEPRTPRNSGVTTDDQPAPEEAKPEAPEPAEPVALEPPPPPEPEPEPEPEPYEPPPPPKFVEPKDPSPPDEEIAKPTKPVKPTKKPAKPAKKPTIAKKPAKPKPKPVAAKPKPKKPAKPAGKWDRNSLFPD